MPRKKKAAWPPVTKIKMDGKDFWLVDVRIGDGKHGRRYYRQTRAEADIIAEQLCIQRQSEGDAAFIIKAEDRSKHTRSADTCRRIAEAKRANFAEGRETGFKDEEFRRRISPLANSKMRGSEHFGRMRRDLPTHAMAKIYEVESPDGTRHRIANLNA